MKYTVENSRITEFFVMLEDDMYLPCTCALVTINHDKNIMNAKTNYGDYTFVRTPSADNESFMGYMSRIDEEYFLSRIAEKTVFDPEKSRKETAVKVLPKCREGLSSGEYKELCQELDDVAASSENDFIAKVQDILGRHGSEDQYGLIECCYDYSDKVRAFARVFRNVLRPMIKKQLEDEVPEIDI